VIDEIAASLGLDPLDVRKPISTAPGDRNVTPYHQTVEDNIIPACRRAGAKRRLRRAARAIARSTPDEPFSSAASR
jgi:xanthine dehydrogenase large subunit